MPTRSWCIARRSCISWRPDNLLGAPWRKWCHQEVIWPLYAAMVFPLPAKVIHARISPEPAPAAGAGHQRRPRPCRLRRLRPPGSSARHSRRTRRPGRARHGAAIGHGHPLCRQYRQQPARRRALRHGRHECGRARTGRHARHLETVDGNRRCRRLGAGRGRLPRSRAFRLDGRAQRWHAGRHHRQCQRAQCEHRFRRQSHHQPHAGAGTGRLPR
ncbi:hypothetical protein D3C72_691650 [compost metagenome]